MNTKEPNVEIKIKEKKVYLADNKNDMYQKESVDYLSLCGVDCSLLAFGEDLVPIRVIKMLYLFFQTCIIKALPSLCAIIVSLTINKKIVFRITCDNAKASIDTSFCQDELDKLGGSITIEQQDDTTYSTLSFDLGGDK